MEIGEKIRYARLQKGYSQENMADFLEISTSAYGDIERNKTELTISRAKKIINILKISWLELFDEKNQASKISESSSMNDVSQLRLEASYWREKFEQQIVMETYRMIQSQYQRERIGF